MKNRFLFVLLVFQTAAVAVYTAIALSREGIDLLTPFLSNVASLGWSGQFNLDFLCYLMLSGLWVMWRSRFSLRAVLTGLMLMVLGIVAFAPYVLFLLLKENGNLKAVLVGERA